jgi:hypothetical protein
MKEIRGITSLILLVLLFWTSTLHAADPIWEYIYGGDILPDDASLGTNAWQLMGDNISAEITDQGELHIDDVGVNHCFFLYNITDAALMQQATIEARVKVLSKSGSANFEVLVGMQDGSNSKWLDLFPDHILLNNTDSTYDVDMTEYRILRMVRDAADIRIYVDDEEVISESHVGAGESWIGFIFGAGCTSCTSEQYWDYLVFTTEGGFSPEELPSYASTLEPELAGDPSPASETHDVPHDVSLSWTPGEFAVKHDVYLGTSLADVNTAEPDTLVSQGQADAVFAPDNVLEFGQTYYWRVDEINGPPDNTIFKGDLWRFTVEPFSIPVETIMATASSSHADNMNPENTVNGIGLNELDQHSTEGTEMWLSGMGDAAPSIQYDFDKVYKLDKLLVWNSNQMIESFVGLGAKDVIIETSVDGAEWTVVEGAILFNQATGTTNYTANTVINFGGVLAQSVKITINAGYGMMPQYGLSEVRFLHIPTFAREPEPANGSTVDSADVVLGWRSGREATLSEVYLGTDAANLALLGTTAGNSITASGLNYATTYVWSVTEINNAEALTSYASDVWSFTTPDFGTVDDFDQYDDNCSRIFFTWEDGLGHNGGEELEGCDVLPSDGNGGGSIVGNATAPFAERTIVNDAGSTQSLPFSYDNAFGQSEAMLRLEGQDWTASGVQTLAIAFYGTAGNTGTLYVKINNTKVVYDGDAADITQEQWQQWNIDLTLLNGLQNVTTLTIGVDGASAAGMLYIDDIRLYP